MTSLGLYECVTLLIRFPVGDFKQKRGAYLIHRKKRSCFCLFPSNFRSRFQLQVLSRNLIRYQDISPRVCGRQSGTETDVDTSRFFGLFLSMSFHQRSIFNWLHLSRILNNLSSSHGHWKHTSYISVTNIIKLDKKMAVIRIHIFGGPVMTSREVLADSHRKVQAQNPVLSQGSR